MNEQMAIQAKAFSSALISALATLENIPTPEEVEQKAIDLARLFNFSGELRAAIEEAMISVTTRMDKGVVIVDSKVPHDVEWVNKREIPRTYSDAYERFLMAEGWPPPLVQTLSDVGTRILGHLRDPITEGAWNRRGLVIGHVQSGKTANYLGVVGKAADAGYKFIVVIAGIHNNLRRQTQERIDEGFIGRSSDPDNRVSVGVGLNSGYPHPATLTTIHEDFNKLTASKSGWKINDFSKPIILIIKKNVSTLSALRTWLKELNAQGDGRIADVPMLLIDDEADNASINTNKPENDPTKTNAEIRKILSLFAKSCYVGYTATPFANIFINPDAYDADFKDELFPRDFIYSLDAPNTYFGPHKIFLDEVGEGRHLRTITDAEEFLPQTHKKDWEVRELPASLYSAFYQFIVARAIRNLRGQSSKHCSMMINVSRFVATQNSVRSWISLHEKKVREAVKAYYAMPEEDASKNIHMRKLKEAYDNEYSGCGATWGDVKLKLMSVFDTFKILVVNSKADEILDYKSYEREGRGLTVVAIGGLSLSRGLTVEGLTVSYMYRNTKMYDTLMQMGRWFGYRPGFEDLCRIHLSSDSIEWYSHIAEASDDLRSQIKSMRQAGLSPRDFGLYVRAHPDSLLITAANKMRSGEKIYLQQNYSGRLIESFILPSNPSDDINRRNEDLIKRFWQSEFGANWKPVDKRGLFACDVPVERIEEFLTRFLIVDDFGGKHQAAIDYLRAISAQHRFGDVLLVSLKAQEDLTNQILGSQTRAFNAKDVEERKHWRLSKDRIASKGDEKLGLTDDQIREAHEKAKNEPDQVPISDRHYRKVRNKPLLMIHVLNPTGTKDRVPAYGISYPYGHFQTEVSVVANQVWLAKMHEGAPDDPADEEDINE